MPPRARRYPEKSSVINFRIQPSTKDLLKKAADASGQTLSAEAEHQLRRALSDMGTGRTHAIMAMLARTIDGLMASSNLPGKPAAKSARAKWWDDPYLFDQAAKLVVAAFEMLRPQGEVVAPTPESGELLGDRSARFAVEATLRDIQAADPSIPFGKQTPYQRWLNMLKADLGPLADRPRIWGFSADEVRVLRALAKPILDELIPLSRKAAQAPQDMTAAETQRLTELRRNLMEIGP
jgi:hypothetical protein